MMSKPIKVLAVVTAMYRAGLESRLMDVIRHMDRSEISVDIYTCRLEENSFDEEAKSLGAIIYYNKPLNVRNFLSYIVYFKNFLLTHPEYRIVHAYQNAWCSVFCLGAYLAGVPVRIAHSRTALRNDGIKSFAKNVIKLPVRIFATHYFAVSEKAGRWLFGNKFWRAGKVKVWKNAIDGSAFRYNEQVRREVRDELGLKEGITVLLHVGNFRPAKNHQYLLRVFEEYHRHDAASVLILVGDGVTKLINTVNDMNLQNGVMFLGSRSDVCRLMQAGDVFVFPSLYEGLPGAVVEAQAAGLPCIIADTIAAETRILPTTKMLPLAEDVSRWCEEICVAKQYKRRDVYDEICASGYDIKAFSRKLTEFYRKIGVDG